MESPIPTVEQMTQDIQDQGWIDLPATVDDLTTKTADVAYDVRQKAATVYTLAPCGYHWNPDDQVAAIHVPHESARDAAMCKAAANRVVKVRQNCLSEREASGGQWIKVAFSPSFGSPTLRRAGELLNFFPGKYPGGIPNSPGPVQGMLTSGLVGAGLGYGAGWLGETMYPDRWRKGRLRKTLAVLGALPGLGLGAAYGMSNLSRGVPLTDNSLFDYQPGDIPQFNPSRVTSQFKEVNASVPAELGERYKCAVAAYVGILEKVAGDVIKEFTAMDAGMIGRGPVPDEPPTSLAVNIDSMGRTLWQTGASPHLAATTMGALHAAQQMPGGREPGWVTPSQMGNLAAHMGVGYLSGGLVGATLGALTGMPSSTQSTLKRTGMYLGIVKAVVPRLFGQ